MPTYDTSELSGPLVSSMLGGCDPGWRSLALNAGLKQLDTKDVGLNRVVHQYGDAQRHVIHIRHAELHTLEGSAQMVNPSGQVPGV